MKFLFLGKGLAEASTRYRVRPVMDRLAAEGHEAQFKSTEMNLVTKLKCLLDAGQYDLIFIQRKLFPVWFVKLLRHQAKRLVFDFDDAIFVKSSGAPSSSRQARFEFVTGQADLVLAGNRYLSDQISAHGNRVLVVPTAVPVERYKTDGQAATDTDSTSNASRAQTIVWIGSSSTRRYLDLLTPALDRLGDMHPRLTLKVIADFDLNLATLKVENVRWSEEDEAMELAACDIGIAPMVNNPWTRGKCALKVIQYMAAGLPVVSDRCGANEEVIQEGETGYLADNEEDWVTHVTELLRDEEKRQRMGEAGRKRALDDYSMSAMAAKTADELLVLASATTNG